MMQCRYTIMNSRKSPEIVQYTICILNKTKKNSPCFPSPGVCGAPVKNGSSSPFAAAAAEDGPLLSAQHRGPDAADVHVRPAGTLDGLHLVHNRQDGDGGQRLQLGYR